MDNSIEFTKESIKEMELLLSDDLKKLNFHELCAYLNMLDLAEEFLEGEE